MNVDSQTMTTGNTASAPASSSSVLFPALLRLALLVGPLTLAIVELAHKPFICVLACVAVVATWLSVDVGPFRAEAAKAPETNAAPLPSFRNIIRPEFWNGLFGRLLILAVLLHSKLPL